MPQPGSEPDRPIPTNSLAFEYVYVANQRCPCGGYYSVTRQRLGRGPSGPTDRLTGVCEACAAERAFTFDISSFFGEFEKYNRFQETEERFREAMIHIRAGEFAQAAAALQEVVDPDEGEPAFAWAHTHLGNVLLQLGNAEAAVVHLERAAEIQPRAPDIQEALARAYRVSGREEEAEGQVQRANALRTQFADADSQGPQDQ
jgi:tetratricopeptide (TPR) repeat protein